MRTQYLTVFRLMTATTRSRLVYLISVVAEYCTSGYERDSSGVCQPCRVGYYKDNTVDLFGKCTQCGKNMGEDPVAKPDFVTEQNASISASNCTIRKSSFRCYFLIVFKS